jgi:aspartyl-tRNA(Asn)/glutamyl-tRNA(Gln) amidotransferase subunit A
MLYDTFAPSRTPRQLCSSVPGIGYGAGHRRTINSVSQKIPIHELDASELGRLLHSRDLDPVEVAEHFIDRVARSESVFISTCFDRALREAAESARRHRTGTSLGALDGVPVAWKDLVDVEGTPTTAGSAVYRDASLAQADAPIVSHASRAGMVTIGKTNLSEFAYSALGLNPHFGTPLNPRARDLPRVPGGSSSGSAVSVAAGLVPVAIGTDTGGSVRTPAAFNGVIGFKASAQRFDKRGVFPLSPTLDTLGVLARSVSDCVLVDQVLRGKRTDPAACAATEFRDLKIVAPSNVLRDEMEPEVRANYLATLERLASLGVRVSQQHVPQLDEIRSLVVRHGNIAAAEAYWLHREIVEGPRFSEVDPTVRRRILAAASMSAYDFIALQQGCLRLGRAMWASLDGALLATPTVPNVAPELAPIADDLDLFAAVNLKTIRFTLLGSMLGSTGLAVPNGLGAAEMPTSILFSAPSGEEDRLLSAGLALATAV